MITTEPIPQETTVLQVADARDIPSTILQVTGKLPSLEENYDLTQIPLDETRLQSRIEANVAPAFMVERYVRQLDSGTFPPIVVSADNVLIDGNTRTRARLKRGERFHPAYVVPIEAVDASEADRDRLMFLSRILNSTNGQPLDEGEIALMVEQAIRAGMTTLAVARLTGASEKVVRLSQQRVAAKRRLDSVGVAYIDLPDAALRAFAGPIPTRLPDEQFGPLAELARDAGLNAAEVRALAREVEEAGDLGASLIDQERDARSVQISERARGEKPTIPGASQLRKNLGYALGRQASEMVELIPDKMADHLQTVKDAVEKLTEVARLQQEAINR